MPKWLIVFVASVITLFIMGVLRIHLKRIFAVIMGAVFTAAALIRCVVFWMNPPEYSEHFHIMKMCVI